MVVRTRRRSALLACSLSLWLLVPWLPGVAGTGVLTSLRADLWGSSLANRNATVQRRGNLDSVVFEDEERLDVCHLISITPLTELALVAKEQHRQVYTSPSALEGVAATLLALQHLNTADGSLVPQVAHIMPQCPNLHFTAQVLDSELQERIAMDHVISLVEQAPPAPSSSNNNNKNNTTPQQTPCAFLGAYRSAVTIPTSTVTSLKGFPQFAALSTSARLNDKVQFPLLGRFNPSDDGTAEAMIRFYISIGVQHVAVVHSNEAYGNTYAAGLQLAAARHGLKLVSVDIPYNLPTNATPTVQQVVQRLKHTNFRYFFGIIWDTRHYDILMQEAVRQGIAGTGRHNWIFSDSVGRNHIQGRSYNNPRGALYRASYGIGIVTPVGGVPGEPLYDAFTHALQALDNPEDLPYIRSQLPRYDNDDGKADFWQNQSWPADFLQTPGLLAPFLYDTVIALGLAACEAVQDAQDAILEGPDHYVRTLQANFTGVTGPIAINPETGTRQASSATFALTNYVPSNNTTMFQGTVTHVFRGGEWTQTQDYVWNDGSTTPPVDIPPVKLDMQHLALPARILIMILGAVVVCLSVGFAWWTHRNSHTCRVVQASQPFFLQLVNVGTLLMGGSIFTLAIDDKIASDRGCTISCAMFPWLLSLGFVVVSSALFTKIHRLNIIVSQQRFRRVTVAPKDVIKPMLFLLITNVAVLSLWSGLSSLEWERVPTQKDEFGRTTESIGRCTYSDSLPFVIVLAVIDIGSLIYACFEGYKAREISTECAESEYVFKSIALVLLVSFTGIPAAILAVDNTTAYNCVVAGSVFCVALSFQLLIFMPKVKFHLVAVLEAEAKKHHGTHCSLFRHETASNHSFAVSAVSGAQSAGMLFFGMLAYHRRMTMEQLEEDNAKLRERIHLLEIENADKDPPSRQASYKDDEIRESRTALVSSLFSDADEQDLSHQQPEGSREEEKEAENRMVQRHAPNEEANTPDRNGFGIRCVEEDSDDGSDSAAPSLGLTKVRSLEKIHRHQLNTPMHEVLYKSARRLMHKSPVEPRSRPPKVSFPAASAPRPTQELSEEVEEPTVPEVEAPATTTTSVAVADSSENADTNV